MTAWSWRALFCSQIHVRRTCEVRRTYSPKKRVQESGALIICRANFNSPAGMMTHATGDNLTLCLRSCIRYLLKMDVKLFFHFDGQKSFF